MRRAPFLALVVPVLLLSCQGSESGPTGPGSSDAPRFAISDAVHGGGNDHFYWLPPMVPSVQFSGTPDGGMSPVVTVCQLVGPDCGAGIARFTMNEGTGSEIVRYDGSQYVVNWHTDRCLTGACALDAQATYRIRVHVGLVELGYADVDVVSNGSQLRNVVTDEFIGLVNGRTLPVKFRIEHGAVAVVAPGETAAVGGAGGLVTTADGNIALDFPAGALTSSTPISITPDPAPPLGAEPWTPVFDLGPDGATFNAPVALTLEYDPATLPEGVTPADLVAYTLVDGAWEVVDGAVVNEIDHTLSVDISHFSKYRLGLVATTSSGVATATVIGIGDETFLTASVCGGSLFCFPLANTRLQWTLVGSAGVLMPQSSVTNAQGRSTVRVVGVSPGGVAVIVRQVGASPLSAAGISLIVRPSLTVTHVVITDAGPNGTEQFSTSRDRDVGVGNQFALYANLPSMANTLVPITVTHTSPTAATLTTPLPVVAFTSRSGAIAVTGLASGRDTIIVSSYGWGRDTLVLDVAPGRLHAQGLPGTLVYGDSAMVRVWPASPSGTSLEQTAVSRPIQVGASGNLQLYDAGSPLIPGCVGAGCTYLLQSGGYASPYFWVKAVGAGTGNVTLTSPNSVTNALSVTITQLGQLGFTPGDRAIVAGWIMSQDLTRSVAESSQLAVSVTNTNRFLVVGEPGTSNYTHGGQTGTYQIAANATTKRLAIAGLEGVGVDTLISSALGYRADTVVVTLVRGMFRVDGWPMGLAVGDSAALTLTVVDHDGHEGSLWNPIDVTLTPSAGLVFTQDDATIGAVHVAQRTSATFFVKAVASGSQSVSMSHRDYVDYTNATTVGLPPTIRVSPGSLTIQVRQGETNSADIQVTNSGGGTLTGLFTGPFSNYFNGSPAPWVTATLSSTTAPATLTITASPDEHTPPGVHQLRFDLVAPGATNSAVTFFSINITVVPAGVTPVNATIVPSPGSLGISVPQGGSSSEHIVITNSGTDPLTDLSVGSFSNYFNGSAAPWVNAYLDATTAPATITILATPDASVAIGTHQLRFDVMSPGATNSPYTFYSINVTVTPSPWFVGIPMPTPRWGMAAAAFGDVIYTIGGNATNHEPYPGGPTTNIVEAFNTATETWTTRQSAPVAREYSMAVVFGGRIYTFGGWLGNLSADNRTFIYSPSGNSWSASAPSPFPVFGGVAAEINGRIYVTTSGCCGSPAGGFLMFDPGTAVWTRLADMPHTHDFAMGGAIGGKLYVVGGQGPSAFLDVFDPATGSWTTMASLPRPRQFGSGLVHQDKLYIFGGNLPGETDGMLEVFVYDPATDTWATETMAPRERSFPSAIAVNGRAYVIGGDTGRTFPASPIGVVDRFILPN